jgi:hypothetical protein
LANTQYTRKIQAYNAADAATSGATSVYTSIEAVSSATWEGVTDTSITVHSGNILSSLESSSSGVYFENTTKGTNSGWIKTNTWTSSSLTPSTPYTFKITTRNAVGVMTATFEASKSTTATLGPNVPSAESFSGITSTIIQANWGANGNPDSTQYYCENTTAGTNSGWITGFDWQSTSLEVSTSYTFRVKAKDASNQESGWTGLGTQETTGYATAEASVGGVSLITGDTISSTPTITVSFGSSGTLSTSSIKPLAILGGVKSVQVDGVDTAYDIISTTDTTASIRLRNALSVGTHTIKIITYDTEGTEYLLERTGLIVASGSVITTGSTLVYPNPYDPLKGSVKITYYLSVDTGTTIYVFDTSGRMVWKSNYMSGTNGGKAGYNEVTWDTTGTFGQLTSDAYIIDLIEQGTGKVITMTNLLVWKGGGR